MSKRLGRSPYKIMSTWHLSPRRLTANVFNTKSRQRGRAETMLPSPRDISIVSKLELHVLFTDCRHDGAITSMEHSTAVQEDSLHHVNDMAGGQQREITTRHPKCRFPSVVPFVVALDSNLSIIGVVTFADAQKETKFVMLIGEDNIVLVDLLFNTSFFGEAAHKPPSAPERRQHSVHQFSARSWRWLGETGTSKFCSQISQKTILWE